MLQVCTASLSLSLSLTCTQLLRTHTASHIVLLISFDFVKSRNRRRRTVSVSPFYLRGTGVSLSQRLFPFLVSYSLLRSLPSSEIIIYLLSSNFYLMIHLFSSLPFLFSPSIPLCPFYSSFSPSSFPLLLLFAPVFAVGMQAIEFWSTVCYCETSVLEDISDGIENAPIYLKLVEQAAPLLVPIMLETLTKQQVRTN